MCTLSHTDEPVVCYTETRGLAPVALPEEERDSAICIAQDYVEANISLNTRREGKHNTFSENQFIVF